MRKWLVNAANVQSLHSKTNDYIWCLQSLEKSKDYFKRKVDYVQEQMDKIDALGSQKSKVLNAVVDVMEMKMEVLKMSNQAEATISWAPNFITTNRIYHSHTNNQKQDLRFRLPFTRYSSE